MTVTVSFAGEIVQTKEYSFKNDSQTWSAKVTAKVDKAQVKPGEEFNISLSVENISGADEVNVSNVIWQLTNYAQRVGDSASNLLGWYSVLDGKLDPDDPYQDVYDAVTKTGTNGLNVSNSSPVYFYSIKASAEEGKEVKISELTLNAKVKTKKDAQTGTAKLFGDAVSLMINTSQTTDGIHFDEIPIEITNNPTDDQTPTETTYTVSAKPSVTSAYVGDTFNVDVVASADQAADLAAVDAVLNYDKDLVKPIGATAIAINTTATPLYYTDGTNGITTDGTGKVYLYGSSAQTGTDGLVVATYQFEALKSGTASFSIADGAKIGKSGTTADIAAASGTASTVAINEVPDEKSLISNADYKGAPTGKQVLKYVAKDMPASGNAYFYGEDTTPLYYAYDNNDGKHVFLGFVDAGLTNDTLAAVTEKTGNYETLSYTGDINKNDSINAVDSLIAYDLATGVYSADSDMSTLTAQRRLEADINKDGTVTAADARAIMFKALGIADPELAQ